MKSFNTNEAASDVTQEDRIAADEYVNARGKKAVSSKEILSGQCDTGVTVQAFARHRIAATRKHDPSALEVLQNLSSYLGAGGLEATSVADLDARIRWSIEHHVNVAILRAANVVEECSKKPSTQWGELKKAILALEIGDNASPSKHDPSALVDALRKITESAERYTTGEGHQECRQIALDALAEASQ